MNNENTFYDFKNVRSKELGEISQICEGEFALPDYVGDLSSIISYDMTPKILSKKQIANKLDLECVLEIRVICLNADNELISYEYKYNFIKSIEDINEDDIVIVNPSIDQTVLRQSAERKIYFKAELTFNTEIYTNQSSKALLSCEEPSFKYKKDNYNVFSSCNLYEKSEVYNDIISLNKPVNDVKTVLRKHSVAFVSDCKIISKKALLKGEIKNDFIYIDTQDRVQKLRTILPFSYVIDINEEETDDIQYNTRCDVISTEITPNIDDDNTFSSYSIKIKLNLFLSVCSKSDVTLINDLYSTVYDTDIEKDNIEIISFKDVYKENITVKKDFEIPEDVNSIYDAWFTVDNLRCNNTDDGVNVTGTINLEYLCSTKDGAYIIVEDKTEFEYNGNIDAQGDICKVIFVPYECEFAVNGNRLSIKFEGNIIIKNRGKQTLTVVTSVNLLDKSDNNLSQIIVYYPDENEDLWEIAKRYKADSDEIATSSDEDQINTSALIIQR